jgi:hypothetical protein
MAALVRRDTTAATTTDNTVFTSASFTPTADDLLVVCIRCTGTVGSNPVLTASANGITFTRVINQFSNASAHKQMMFVANQKVPSSPSAMTVTVTLTSGDTATSCIMGVIAITGMSRVGTDAIRNFSSTPQIIATDNNKATGGSAGVAVLPAAPLTTNPLIGFVGVISTAGMTPPTSWTELLDQNNATPTNGFEIVGRASGQTSATITTGSNMTVGALAFVEFDASVPATSGGPFAGIIPIS